jgi:hypothetical protein
MTMDRLKEAPARHVEARSAKDMLDRLPGLMAEAHDRMAGRRLEIEENVERVREAIRQGSRPAGKRFRL